MEEMDTVMVDTPAGEYDASPDPMEGVVYHPSTSLFGHSYQTQQQTPRRNLFSSPSLQPRPTLQFSTLRDRQARRQQTSRRWQPRPNDPFYHDMEEARADNRAEQREFDRSHLQKRNGARFPFSSPKRTRTAYEQDTSDQRRVVNATPRRVVDVVRPLLEVTPPPPIDVPSRQIGGIAPQNLLDGSPRLFVDATPQPLVNAAPQQIVPVSPQPIQMPQWPAALYRRATWRAAIPPWRIILVPVSRIAQLARCTAQLGIKQTIQTGLGVASAFAHLFDRRDESPMPAPETQIAAPAPVSQPAPQLAAELGELEEPEDPVSSQLQAELTGHTSQLPCPPSPSPSTPIENFRPRRRLESPANTISEEDSIRMMVSNATREARDREMAEAAERATTQPLGEDGGEAEQSDFEPDAEPQFALVPPLAPWVRSPIPFNPAVPQVAPWFPMSSTPSSPVIIPSPRPAEETPALNLAPPAHPVNEAPALGLVPTLRPIDENPALRLIPSSSRVIDTIPASRPMVPSLLAVEDTPALDLAPIDETPELDSNSLHAVDAIPAQLPIVPPLPRPIDVTPALRVMLSSSRPVETAPSPPPIVPTSPPLHDASFLTPIVPSSSRSISDTLAARPASSPSRRLPVTPVTRLIPPLMRRYRGTPAPRRTTPRVPRPPLDADLEETRDLLSTVTVSGEDGIIPTRIQWWEADTPLGRPVSAVRLFSSNEPPANVSDRTGALYRDEYEEMQREARMRVIRERTMALSRQRVPEGEDAVRPLTERLERQVHSAMSAPSNRVLGSTLYGAELTKKDLLSCYQDLEWLNDEVINGHLALTVDYLREKANNTGRNVRPKYFALSTFFYPKLRDGGYKGVSRWARRGKIEGEHLLDVETVFVPVHQQSHWTLLVVSPANKTIEYFDSLGSRWRSFVDTIKEWLEGELGEKYVEDEWTVLRTPSPRQDNGSDCGVFLLTTAKAVALGLEPTAYGPGDVPLLRKKIVAELLNSGFRGDLDPSGPGPARL